MLDVFMPADALLAIRKDIGASDAGGDFTPAILERLDDLIGAVDAAEKALAKLPHPSISDAAAQMAHLFYVSGRGWRRYLAESPHANRTEDVRKAVMSSAQPVLSLLEGTLRAREPQKVTQRGGGGFGLPCAACGSDAVTLSLTRLSAAAPEQLVVSSLSPVTVFRPITGPRMQDLIRLLEAGVVDAVVGHLRETQPAGCDAWCEVCSRLYCKSHYAVEAQWSGSWHEATYATCPLGHEHDID
jgi:hypothetical protein